MAFMIWCIEIDAFKFSSFVSAVVLVPSLKKEGSVLRPMYWFFDIFINMHNCVIGKQ